MSLDELVRRARRWRDDDPDPVTRAQLDSAIARARADELEPLVGSTLGFGTAGIRGPLGPGPARMNRATVRRCALGISGHLAARHAPASARTDLRPTAVVGHDARHGSADMAEEAARTLCEQGVDVDVLDGVVPTPLLAFALRDGGHDVGLMVTASHNPAGDNGLKVFGSDGAQIAAPVDESIASHMAHPSPHDGEPGRARRVATSPSSELAGRYLDELARLCSPGAGAGLRVAATALHGVGAELLDAALATIGVSSVHHVATQRAPDPDFPTAPRPNPEEPGVLDPLLELAHSIDADVALALDPDADRLAVAVPTRSGWRQLGGDELGALLSAFLIERSDPLDQRLICTTVVSSQLTARMCAAAGVHHVETLTGFKWLARPALAHPRWQQLLLYEEALGYAIGPMARDKDGIAAAAVVCDMLATWRSLGHGPGSVLDELARAHGAHVQRNGSVVAPTGSIDRVLAALGPPTDRPAPDVHRWLLGSGTRVVVRPSGTEPKLKYYLEAVEPVRTDEPVADARRRAAATLERVLAPLLDALGSGEAGAR